MIRSGTILACLALECAAASARQLSPSPVPSAAPMPAAPVAPTVVPPPVPNPDYRVGVGDVLDVVVFGNEDVSRTATVQTDGRIAVPLVGDVPVAGLTVEEVKQKLTNLLERDYLVNPQVEVRVREYQSQFVTVLGEVNSPGRKPLRGRTRLIDVLVESGGLNPRASGEIVITRTEGGFEGGHRSLTLRLGGATLRPQDEIALQMPLQVGDIISASPKYYVTVEGEVVRPGRYVLENDLTVSGAVSSAGGLTRFGSNGVKVRRIDPGTGGTLIIPVDLKGIRRGKRQDPMLEPNDVVSVPRRLF